MAPARLAALSQYCQPPLTVGWQYSTHGPTPCGGGMSRHPPSSHAPIVPDGLPTQSGQHPQGASPTNRVLFVAFGFVVECTEPTTFGVFALPTPFRVAFAMFRPARVFAAAVLAALSGCGPPAPKSDEPHEVGPDTLARD